MTAPAPGEYAPAFAGYAAKAQSVTDPVEALTTQLDEVLAMFHMEPMTAYVDSSSDIFAICRFTRKCEEDLRI